MQTHYGLVDCRGQDRIPVSKTPILPSANTTEAGVKSWFQGQLGLKRIQLAFRCIPQTYSVPQNVFSRHQLPGKTTSATSAPLLSASAKVCEVFPIDEYQDMSIPTVLKPRYYIPCNIVFSTVLKEGWNPNLKVFIFKLNP